MKENFFKAAIRKFLLPHNAIRPIVWGALAGYRFRVNEITRLAPVISGHERDNQNLFKQHIKTGDTVLDVGACWGMHTLLFSKLVGESGQVFAFEPDPRNFAELQFHVELNKLQNVHCLPLALSNFNGESTFHCAAEASMGSLIKQEGREGETIAVSVRTLDSLAPVIGLVRADFLKIDIEGVEADMLEGARQTLQQMRPTLVIDKDSDESLTRCHQWLENLKYHCEIRQNSMLATPASTE